MNSKFSVALNLSRSEDRTAEAFNEKKPYLKLYKYVMSDAPIKVYQYDHEKDEFYIQDDTCPIGRRLSASLIENVKHEMKTKFEHEDFASQPGRVFSCSRCDSNEVPIFYTLGFRTKQSMSFGDHLHVSTFINAQSDGICILVLTGTDFNIRANNFLAAKFANSMTLRIDATFCTKCEVFLPSLKKCKKCDAKYCSLACRDADWKRHKRVCLNAAQRVCCVCSKQGSKFACECCPNWYCSVECKVKKDAFDAEFLEALDALSLGGAEESSEESAEDPLPCQQCGKEGSLKLCGRCNEARYCSKQCQVAHWKLGHQQECRKAGAAVSAPAVCPKCFAPMGSSGAAGALCAQCSE